VRKWIGAAVMALFLMGAAEPALAVSRTHPVCKRHKRAKMKAAKVGKYKVKHWKKYKKHHRKHRS
jgi:hypothetical protein